MVVGLTVVAFGTAAPELVVSVLAAARGTTDVALGNGVGSNISNLFLILGLAAAIRPLSTQRGLATREVPLMTAAALAVPLLALDARIGRGDGAALLAGFALSSSGASGARGSHPRARR